MAVATPAPRVLADVVPYTWVRDVVLVVAATVLVALSAQVAIPLPFTPVPLTGQTFAVLLAGAVLGTWRGVASMLLYGALAVLGLPVLAPNAGGGHTTGTAVFALPSFGYVLGFVLAAGVVGALAERGATRTPLRTAGLMVLGNVVIYAVGVTWLKVSIGVSWATAFSLGLTPFVAGDLVKIALAAGLLPLCWAGLRRVGLAD
jgi:biotin transport system substrate-specific component